MDGLSAEAEGSAGSCARMFGAQRPRRRIDIDRWVSTLALVAKEAAAGRVAAAALRALAEEAIVNDETRGPLSTNEREREKRLELFRRNGRGGRSLRRFSTKKKEVREENNIFLSFPFVASRSFRERKREKKIRSPEPSRLLFLVAPAFLFGERARE